MSTIYSNVQSMLIMIYILIVLFGPYADKRRRRRRCIVSELNLAWRKNESRWTIVSFIVLTPLSSRIPRGQSLPHHGRSHVGQLQSLVVRRPWDPP